MKTKSIIFYVVSLLALGIIIYKTGSIFSIGLACLISAVLIGGLAYNYVNKNGED